MTRWFKRWSGVLASLLFLVAGTAGLAGMNDVREDGERELRAESKARAREVCEGTNDATAAARAGFDSFRDVLIAVATEGDPSTPERQEAIDAFNRRFDREVLDELAPIDCDAVVDGEQPAHDRADPDALEGAARRLAAEELGVDLSVPVRTQGEPHDQ